MTAPHRVTAGARRRSLGGGEHCVGARHCAECGHRASERARFCERCGDALTATAEPLRAPSALEARILGERTSIEGERKQVTVMYTDIVGSMQLTHALDEERWGVLLDRFLAIAARAVHAYEGTVNQFTGDGLLAVFGAPLAHEDHAHRACLAVLRLQREVQALADEIADRDGVTFAIRCGMNSGEVVVGEIGDDVHMDFVPIGITTSLGKRIESLAPEGSAAMSATTAALVEGDFVVHELGEFEVKGAPGRQRVFELVRPRSVHRSRLTAVAETRGLSPFVGRDTESAVLGAALERMLAGDGQAIGILGDAGVGKSRLVHEFTAACAARGLLVMQASCAAHGRDVPFLPMLDLDRQNELGLLEPAPVGDRLDPVARLARLRAHAIATIRARSRRRPAVILVEDVHWIDEASATLLEGFVEATRGTRTLVLATYRPERPPAWPGESPHAEVRLEPLDPVATDDLLSGLLGADRSLDGLAVRIGSRTGGNPFFIEETVQALAEDGRLTGTRARYRLVAPLEDLALPPTVHAGLAARIDRLPPPAKALLQRMSVVGTHVPADLLGAISPLGARELAAAIDVLARAQLVLVQDTPEGREHVFKHPLTREVAYASQLSEPQARAHAAVADAIERIHPDGLDERAALLARHHEAAGDPLGAARWHARAADWSSTTSLAAGLRHWQRVREITGTLEATAERDDLARRAHLGVLSMAWRLGLPPDERAVAHAGSRAGLLADLFLAGGHMHGGREHDGLELFRTTHRTAIGRGDRALGVTASCGVSYAAWIAGHLGEALEVTGSALAAAGDDPTLGSGLAFGCPLAHVYGDHGRSLGYGGDRDGSQGAFARAIALAQEADDPETEAAAYANRAHLHADLGEHEAALADAALGRALGERAGNVVHVAACDVPGAMAHAGLGRHAEALAGATEALATIREVGVGLYFEPALLATIARARLASGEPALARDAAEQAVAIMTARGLRTCALQAPLALAEVLRATEGEAAEPRIVPVLERALDVARSSGARILEVRIQHALAAAAGTIGALCRTASASA